MKSQRKDIQWKVVNDLTDSCLDFIDAEIIEFNIEFSEAQGMLFN